MTEDHVRTRTEFDVVVEPVRDGSGVVAVIGEADLFGAPRLKEALLSVADAGATRIVVDMTEAEFIDSTTLGVLLAVAKRLRPNGRLVLVTTHPSILKILQITVLDQTFPIFPTRESALAAER